MLLLIYLCKISSSYLHINIIIPMIDLFVLFIKCLMIPIVIIVIINVMCMLWIVWLMLLTSVMLRLTFLYLIVVIIIYKCHFMMHNANISVHWTYYAYELYYVCNIIYSCLKYLIANNIIKFILLLICYYVHCHMCKSRILSSYQHNMLRFIIML